MGWVGVSWGARAPPYPATCPAAPHGRVSPCGASCSSSCAPCRTCPSSLAAGAPSGRWRRRTEPCFSWPSHRPACRWRPSGRRARPGFRWPAALRKFQIPRIAVVVEALSPPPAACRRGCSSRSAGVRVMEGVCGAHRRTRGQGRACHGCPSAAPASGSREYAPPGAQAWENGRSWPALRRIRTVKRP